MMKIKVSSLVLCAVLVFLVFSGCGLQMPEYSDASPSVSSADGTADAQSEMKTVTGIVTTIDDGKILLDLVRKLDALETGNTGTIEVGSSVYVMTAGTYLASPDSNTVFLLETQGYTSGTPEDIAVGDFLVAAVRGSTVIAIIDCGPTNTDAIGTQPEVSPTASPNVSPTVNPTVSPTVSPDVSALPSPAVPDSSEQASYTVTTDGLKVRSGPGTTYSVLGVLDTGSKETGTISDGWLKFTFKGETAYISAAFLAVSSGPGGVPDSTKSKTYITADKLTVRSGPGTTYSNEGTLEKGTKVTGTVADGWLKFTYNDNTAYCSAAYLTAG